MRRIVLSTLFAALALVAPGCFSLDLDGDGDIDVPPPGGYETDYISCANGRDDDLDGRIDCEDTDCLMNGHCGEFLPEEDPLGYENTFDSCSNGRDDDDDGQFDCGDRGCQNIFELCCLLEFDDESCSNLLDDDGNGFADCADFSCRNNPYVSVCGSELDCIDGNDNCAVTSPNPCGDGRDNDGDRLADCRDDDCADDPACDESDVECDNGVDDDGDELIDCEDPSCFGSAACPPETQCTDGMDNNGNGLTDCADPSCQDPPDPSCVGAEDTLARCQDGFDNDGNGFTDCGDFSCSRSMDMTIVDYCDSILENSLARCMDDIDNDGNGYTDCEDFSCSRAMDMEVVQYCLDLEESTLAECMNGADDDGDGFTDCGDYSCSRDGTPEALEYCSTISERTIALCQDGIDNDGNGFTDCADFSCQFRYYQRGTHFCETAEDCPGPQFACRETQLENPELRTEAPYCFAGCADDTDCPDGWICGSVDLPGGTLRLCVDTCATDADCPLGDSCFRGTCLSIIGPCDESVYSNEDSNFQGATDLTTATCGEQLSMSLRSCTDGVDGDNDGFTDCEDWECNHNPRARVVPAGMRPDQCFVETAAGSTSCTPVRNADGTAVCPAICRYAGGRTCLVGPQAGQACASDDDCGGAPRSCSPPGPRGREFVCPQ